MIEIYHVPRTRSNRAVWALEELGVPYKANTFAFGQHPPEILKHNPGKTVPLMIDGDVVLFESVTIMEYIAETYGRGTPLVAQPGEPNYWTYRQMMMFGEATLAAPVNAIVGTLFGAPEDQRENFTMGVVRNLFRARQGVVSNRLKEGRYVAGDSFTLADISVAYGLNMAISAPQFGLSITDDLKDYVARVTDRDAYRRMLQVKS